MEGLFLATSFLEFLLTGTKMPANEFVVHLLEILAHTLAHKGELTECDDINLKRTYEVYDGSISQLLMPTQLAEESNALTVYPLTYS